MREVSWAKLLLSRTSAVFLLMQILLLPTAASLIVTPQIINLTNYATNQENVVTFLNDDFQPIKLQLTPDFYSFHLAEYVDYEPKSFILNPNEQKNVKITTSFPKELTPQEQHFTLLSNPGSDTGASIVFRPTGVAQPLLELIDINAQKDEDGQTLLVTIKAHNKGNVHVLVTPRLVITGNGSSQKELEYKQPLFIMKKDVYTLTLRQDIGDLEPGVYEAVVKASYEVDTKVKETQEVLTTFSIDEEIKSVKNSSWWKNAAIGSSVAIVILGYLWLRPKKNGSPKKKATKIIRKDLKLMKKEVTILANDVKKLSDQMQKYKGT